MKPGATTLPLASMRRPTSDSGGAPASSSRNRSSSMATLAGLAGAPDPSTTWPFSIKRSMAIGRLVTSAHSMREQPAADPGATDHVRPRAVDEAAHQVGRLVRLDPRDRRRQARVDTDEVGFLGLFQRSDPILQAE